MAADTLRVEIVTPERAVFNDVASQVVIPGTVGELGVLPGHLRLQRDADEGQRAGDALGGAVLDDRLRDGGDVILVEGRLQGRSTVAGGAERHLLRRIGWIFAAREQMLEFNVPVALALESMMVALRTV